MTEAYSTGTQDRLIDAFQTQGRTSRQSPNFETLLVFYRQKLKKSNLANIVIVYCVCVIHIR